MKSCGFNEIHRLYKNYDDSKKILLISCDIKGIYIGNKISCKIWDYLLLQKEVVNDVLTTGEILLRLPRGFGPILKLNPDQGSSGLAIFTTNDKYLRTVKDSCQMKKKLTSFQEI